MNTYFKIKDELRWTWQSSNGTTKNEINYVITHNKNIILDTKVVNCISIGSDHRIVRAKVIVNIKLERKKFIGPKNSGIDTVKLINNRLEYANKRREHNVDNKLSIDQLNINVTQHFLEIAQIIAWKSKQEQKNSLTKREPHPKKENK